MINKRNSFTSCIKRNRQPKEAQAQLASLSMFLSIQQKTGGNQNGVIWKEKAKTRGLVL
jgi:hypothetical protein